MEELNILNLQAASRAFTWVTKFYFNYLYIYIYKTETFETPTIFHVSTIFKLNFPPHHYFLFPMQIRLLAK